MNSVTHSDAPRPRQTRRNAASVKSSIGARTTGLASRTWATRDTMPIVARSLAGCLRAGIPLRCAFGSDAARIAPAIEAVDAHDEARQRRRRASARVGDALLAADPVADAGVEHAV